MSSDKIRAIAASVENQATYPASPTGQSLKLVAKLIGGGLPTRVYYVSQGGYDTHTNQVGTQQRLLKDLGDSMKAFIDDLKAQGNMGRVVVMTFSEFGRRVTENANGGTDHGAAAPMFVVGNKVRPACWAVIPASPRRILSGRHPLQRGFPQRLCRRAGRLAQDQERANSGSAICAAESGVTVHRTETSKSKFQTPENNQASIIKRRDA